MNSNTSKLVYFYLHGILHILYKLYYAYGSLRLKWMKKFYSAMKPMAIFRIVPVILIMFIFHLND